MATGNSSFTGINYQIPNLNFNYNLSSNLNIINSELTSLSVSNNPQIGTTITGYLPASYYTSSFPLDKSLLLVDNFNNYIPLPTDNSWKFISGLTTVTNFGPDTTKGGSWIGTLGIGTSLLSPVSISYNLVRLEAPYSTAINLDLYATGTNNYTGVLQYNHLTIAPGLGRVVPVYDPGDAIQKYLCLYVGGVGTVGTGFGIGSAKFTFSMTQFL